MQPRSVLSILLLVVSFFGGGACSQTYNPVTGTFDRTIYDRQDEIRVGASSYPRMIQLSHGKLGGDELQSYVSEVGHRIAQVSHDPFFDYEFTVVNDSAPNAWALPGGKIAVTRGLLMKMSSEGQLAAVLGHEITHVTARHSAKQQTRALATNLVFLAGAVALSQASDGELGTVEKILMFGGQIGVQLYLASYSRDHERQADELGTWYMARAGYDPEGMVKLHTLFRDLQKRRPSAVEVWFSTHPPSADRIQSAESRVRLVRSQVDIPKANRVNRFEERVVQVWHKREDAYQNMDEGVQAMQNRRYDRASAHFRTAIDRYDDEALFHSWHALAKIKQGHRPAAYDSIQRSLSLRPDLFHTRMTAGRVYMEGNDHRNSLKHFREARDMVEVIPMIDYYIGRNHEALGQRSQAVDHYRTYLKRGGGGEKRAYVRERLKGWGVIKEPSERDKSGEKSS